MAEAFPALHFSVKRTAMTKWGLENHGESSGPEMSTRVACQRNVGLSSGLAYRHGPHLVTVVASQSWIGAACSWQQTALKCGISGIAFDVRIAN